MEVYFYFSARERSSALHAAASHRNRGADRGQRRVIMHREILDPVIEYCFGPPRDLQPGDALRASGELFLDQVSVIEIEVHVPAHPHQFSGKHIDLLRDHPRQQRGRPQVERQAQRHIAAALVEQTVEPRLAALPRDMELIGLVAGGQRHAIKLGDVPAFDDVAAAAGTGAQGFDHRGDLIDPLTLLVKSVRAVAIGRPVDPLLAIDRPQIAPARGETRVIGDSLDEILQCDRLAGCAHIIGVWPFIPDLHALEHQRADVGVAGEEPQQFARGGLPVDPLGGEQRHGAICQIESQHAATHRPGADTGAIDPLAPAGPDGAHQIEILLFRVRKIARRTWNRAAGHGRDHKVQLPACHYANPHL